MVFYLNTGIYSHVKTTWELVFQRATSLKDCLTSSHYKPTVSRSSDKWGTKSKCGQCPHCSWILHGATYRLPNGELFTSRTTVNCATCDCKAFYVGKTIRELRQFIGDHLYCSTNGKLTTIGHHVGLYHRFNPLEATFLALKVIPLDPRSSCSMWPSGWRGWMPPFHLAWMRSTILSLFIINRLVSCQPQIT